MATATIISGRDLPQDVQQVAFGQEGIGTEREQDGDDGEEDGDAGDAAVVAHQLPQPIGAAKAIGGGSAVRLMARHRRAHRPK
jgi:hypothetical protein